ncbi:hypothetical protein [Paenibacillus sp. FSL H8-0537]|uniref:hypothetical protein n=1 Tax=Paenibacillus sp. FSL H8-0537 TaxID=2921399 RepID=UPI0031018135
MEKHPQNVVHLHDDMFGYMQDSLKWIKTYNPDKNKSELGFKEDPKQSGYYDKWSFSKKELLDTLCKLIEFAKQVEAEEYKILYCGI